jgi:hypothetical protein
MAMQVKKTIAAPALDWDMGHDFWMQYWPKNAYSYILWLVMQMLLCEG